MTSTTTDPVPAWDGAAFDGAKVAALWRGHVITLLRDDRPDLPWPGWWDLPGGGRMADESPWGCVCREAWEELRLDLTAQQPRHASLHHAAAGQPLWFFVLDLIRVNPAALHLGDEGQAWRLMPLARFLTHPKVIPQFQTRLRSVV